MAKELPIVHHADRRRVTAAAVYHSHPHREEEFDLPSSMREQAVLWATRLLTDVSEQDDLNRVWVEYLGPHLPTTTTGEVSRLATNRRCKLEITGIAVTDARGRARHPRGPRRRRARR